MKADLHIHTNQSDGKDSPTELLEDLTLKHTKKDHLYISFADHHLFTLKKLQTYGHIILIPGIEFSAIINGYSCHFVGYGTEPKITQELQKLTTYVRNGYQKRALLIFRKLRKLGFSLSSFKTLRDKELPPPIYTFDFAQALKPILGMNSETEVLEWSKNHNNVLWVEEEQFLPQAPTVIQALHKAGCKVFWAHPGTRFAQNNNYTLFETLLEIFKEVGLDGIEAFHPEHTKSQISYFVARARRFQFLISGGSDYHGIGRGPKTPLFLLQPRFLKQFLRALKI